MPNPDDEVPIFKLGGRIFNFDPVELAELTPEQVKKMELFAASLRHLKDARGMRIMPPKIDFWLIAQMVRMLYRPDGTARTSCAEVVGSQFGGQHEPL